jgi:hypothetical protein
MEIFINSSFFLDPGYSIVMSVLTLFCDGSRKKKNNSDCCLCSAGKEATTTQNSDGNFFNVR